MERRGARWQLVAVASVALLLLWLWRASARPESAQLRRELGMPVEGRDLPLIFIGGVPRSGTTLMRAMLDAHPDVRCGQETRLLPSILQLRQYWMGLPNESMRLEQAGVSKTILDNAIAAFCLEVIVRHGYKAPRLCNKDPLAFEMSTYTLELFPHAKFLFMARDGRASVHSFITRKLRDRLFNITSYRHALTQWNSMAKLMYQQCMAVSADKCLLVRYEALVLRPRETLSAVLDFLQLPWNDAVLHHERYINQPNGVMTSE